MPQTLYGGRSATFVSGTVSQFKVTVTVNKEVFLVADPGGDKRFASAGFMGALKKHSPLFRGTARVWLRCLISHDIALWCIEETADSCA